jgi:hypothetical protein
MQELAVSPMTSTVHWGESVFHLSTLQAVGDILVTHSESRQSSNSEIWEELRPRLDLLALITLWRTLEPGDIESSLNDAFIRELKLLAQRANCSSPHDKVYGERFDSDSAAKYMPGDYVILCTKPQWQFFLERTLVIVPSVVRVRIVASPTVVGLQTGIQFSWW